MAGCSVTILYIDSFVPLNALDPTAIRVAVDQTNCPGGDVVVRTDHTGQSSPTPVPVGGAVIELPVTIATKCGDQIIVEAWCAADPTCKVSPPASLPLPCNQCVRAHVSYTAGTCTGSPSVQPVTLTAEIGLKPGQSTQFSFDYGDGSFGAAFTVTNSTTSASTVITHVEPPHNYSPGTYLAKLVVLPLGSECGPFSASVVVNCPPICPLPSNAGPTDLGCVAVAGVGKMRRTALSVTVTTTALSTTAQWVLRKQLPGGMLGSPIYGAPFGCPGSQIVTPALQVPPGPQLMDLDPGDYEATLVFLYPQQACPGLKFNLTADCCAPDCPTVTITPQVTGCAPMNALVTLNATLSWQTGQVQVPVSYYNWTVTWTDQSVSPPVIRTAQNSSVTSSLTPVIKSNDSGWTGNGSVAGHWDVGQPGDYQITVQAVIPGVSPTASPCACNATATLPTPLSVPACNCPGPLTSGTQWSVTGTTAPLGPNKFQTVACDQAATQITIFVDPGAYPTNALRYDWTFPDGTTVLGAGPIQPFTFKNAQAGVTQTHTVNVTVRVPNSTCQPFSRSVDVTVPACVTPGPPPQPTGCSVTSGPSGTVTVTFDQDVDATSATDPNNYAISINNGTSANPSAGSLTYDAATKTTAISGLSITPGDSVTVIVTGVKNTANVVMTSPGQTSCAAPGPAKPPKGLTFCEALLWISIILMLVGGVLVILACLLTKVAPQASTVLYIIGGILWGLGILAFIGWLLFCSAFTSCRILLDVMHFVGWLIVVAGVIAAVLTIIGLVVNKDVLLCAGIAWAWGFNWGLVYWALYQVGKAKACIIENSEPASSTSASGLSAAARGSRPGILPCGCHE